MLDYNAFKIKIINMITSISSLTDDIYEKSF